MDAIRQYAKNPMIVGIVVSSLVAATQVKEASTTGRFSYIQSGGSLYINNLSDSRGSSAVFALPQA